MEYTMNKEMIKTILRYAIIILFFPVWVFIIIILAIFTPGAHYKKGEDKKD